MQESTFWAMALMIVVLWIVLLRGAYVLRRVAADRDYAWSQWAHHETRRNYWHARAIEIEREAQLAWHAYHAAPWPTVRAGIEQLDRDAFERLGEVLDRYNNQGKVI